ncbi:hypothetical protein SLE2022_370200 [Rubroshorea leprosula]
MTLILEAHSSGVSSSTKGSGNQKVGGKHKIFLNDEKKSMIEVELGKELKHFLASPYPLLLKIFFVEIELGVCLVRKIQSQLV